MTENELFQETNNFIMKGQSCAESGNARQAISNYSSAISNLKMLIDIDRVYYQKYLYAIYDEMGIISYTKLNDYKKAYEYFNIAYSNCKECADREPGGVASRDLLNILSRRSTAADAAR